MKTIQLIKNSMMSFAMFLIALPSVKAAPIVGTATLSINDFSITAGEEKELVINLTNPNDELTLVQFDLYLPNGLSIKTTGNDLDIDMADRTNWRKHTLDANTHDGYTTFLLYSGSNALIEGTDGAIIKVKLVAENSFSGGKIILENILLVNPEQEEIKQGVYEYIPVGIQDVVVKEDGNVTIHDLLGKKLVAPQKGINIIRYTNGATKKTFVK